MNKLKNQISDTLTKEQEKHIAEGTIITKRKFLDKFKN